MQDARYALRVAELLKEDDEDYDDTLLLQRQQGSDQK